MTTTAHPSQSPVTLATQRLAHFVSQLPATDKKRFDRLTPTVHRELQRCWTGSDYAWDICCQRPTELLNWIEAGLLHRGFEHSAFERELDECIGLCNTEKELMSVLRRYRHRHLVRIVFRDLNRLASTPQTTSEMSSLADCAIRHAYSWLYERLCVQLGTPRYAAQRYRCQHMTILGMGKLGGEELNLSSDVDLLFCYPEKGEVGDGSRPLGNQEFFVKLGQKLIHVLGSTTAEGFVFRVDMRLRPYGQSGPLAQSYAAMLHYYRVQGRQWERYALIKARVIVGDSEAPQLLRKLRPFIYRRYSDFGTIPALREMQQLIQTGLNRSPAEDNIKIGPGGIRDVEFIVQGFQLVYGGRQPQLRQANLLAVIDELEALSHLPEQACQQLRAANLFFRTTEHALQAVADQQTHTLPTVPFEQERLAWVMGYRSWSLFYTDLNGHRTAVRQLFATMFSGSRDEEYSCAATAGGDIWTQLCSKKLNRSAEIALLAHFSGGAPEKLHAQLTGLRDGRALKMVSPRSRQRLDLFMPHLLVVVAAVDSPCLVLSQALRVVEAVLRRTTYLTLLTEDRRALDYMIALCVKSPVIIDQIHRYPVLLGELASLDTLKVLPDPDRLYHELHDALNGAGEDDEACFETLRHFRMSHLLRLTAARADGKILLMKESDYLTWVAEAILRGALDLALRQLNSGSEHRHRAVTVAGCGFLIVGYGKLGGLEMGPESDLDLVFLCEDGEEAESHDRVQYFTRIAQRVIHILSIATLSGQLYQVDTRLRPCGRAGTLTSSLTTFANYQHKQAWTWEHQALVRARPIAGDDALARQFGAVRHAVLSRSRHHDRLACDVRQMRNRMAQSTAYAKVTALSDDIPADDFLKHARGCIVDLEFMVQYGVLAMAQFHPTLSRWTDTVRLLDELAQTELLSTSEAEQLKQAYTAFRHVLHHRQWQSTDSPSPLPQIDRHRAHVTRLWNRVLRDSIASCLNG